MANSFQETHDIVVDTKAVSLKDYLPCKIGMCNSTLFSEITVDGTYIIYNDKSKICL